MSSQVSFRHFNFFCVLLLLLLLNPASLSPDSEFERDFAFVSQNVITIDSGESAKPPKDKNLFSSLNPDASVASESTTAQKPSIPHSHVSSGVSRPATASTSTLRDIGASIAEAEAAAAASQILGAISKSTISSPPSSLPTESVNFLNETNINDFDASGGTPLMFAASKGSLMVIKSYIKIGADVNLQHKKTGKTALMIAIEGGYYYSADAIMVSGSDFNLRSFDGNTALLLAVSLNQKELVGLMMMRGAPPDQRITSPGFGNGQGMQEGPTALMMAAQSGYVDIVNHLIRHGAQVNAATRTGETALMFAAIQGNKEVVDVLLKADCNVNAFNNRGLTALMMASSRGRVEILESLIENNANLDAVDRAGMTAMLYAMDQRQEGSVSILRSAIEKKRQKLEENGNGNKNKPAGTRDGIDVKMTQQQSEL